MIGNVLRAELGRRLAGRHNGLKGAVLGAAAPWLLRRAFTPLGIAVMGGLAAKSLYDRKKQRDRAATNPTATA